MNKEELVEWATIPMKELTDEAEVLYNFESAMTIEGITSVLWQMCRKQVRKAYSHPGLALIDRGQEFPVLTWKDVEGTAIEVDSETWVKFLVMLEEQVKRVKQAGCLPVIPLAEALE